MSIYSAGAASAAGHGGYVPRRGDDELGAIVMPSAIRDEILTVDASFTALAKLIDARRSALPGDFITGWDSFKGEWSRFRDDHRSWLSRTWGMSYTKALEYRARLETWRQKFEQLTGAKINFPSPGATPESTNPAQSAFPWNKVFWGAAIIGGLWAATKFVGEARGAKRDLLGDRPVFGGAPRGLVRNPPAWALDPEKWESARLAVEPYADHYENPHAVMVHVYKQMGGRQG